MKDTDADGMLITETRRYKNDGNKEIQSILQISQKTAYNLVRQALATGDLFKVIKIGNRYKIPTESFLNWLDQMD